MDVDIKVRWEMIKWKKAGRPREKPKEEKPWTRDELRVKSNGYVSLAIAVIQQWKEDGQHEYELPNLEMWLNIIKMHEEKVTRQYTIGEQEHEHEQDN